MASHRTLANHRTLGFHRTLASHRTVVAQDPTDPTSQRVERLPFAVRKPKPGYVVVSRHSHGSWQVTGSRHARPSPHAEVDIRLFHEDTISARQKPPRPIILGTGSNTPAEPQ